MSVEDVISDIEFETSLIDQLFVVYAELLGRAQQAEPTLIEVTALD